MMDMLHIESLQIYRYCKKYTSIVGATLCHWLYEDYGVTQLYACP